MMKRQEIVLIVKAESSCLEKIADVLDKLQETGDIETWGKAIDGTVIVIGYVDPEKLRTELENEIGDAIKSSTDPTKSIHSGRDGTLTVTKLEDPKHLEYWNRYGTKIPRMPIPESDDRRTEILYHSEKPMEHSNNSQWRSRGVMANNLKMGDAGGSEFPKMPTTEVFDNSKVILNRNEKIMKSSKKQCSIL